MAEISVSYLSQIENNKVNASISTLQILANVLNIQVADLFIQSEKKDYSIIRKDERKTYGGADGIKESILFFHEESSLETTIIDFVPKSSMKYKSKHVGEEFTYVLQGKITINLDNQVFNLDQGDIIYYDSDLEHSWENKENEKTSILVVNTPKSF